MGRKKRWKLVLLLFSLNVKTEIYNKFLVTSFSRNDNTNEIIISNKNTHTQIDKIEDNIVKIFYKNYNLCYNQTFEELFNIIFLDFHTYIKYTFINTIYSK